MPTAANAEEYAKIVKEKSVLRHLVALARQIAEQGYQEQDSQQLLLEAEKAFAKLSEQKLQKNFVEFPEAIVEVFKLIEQRFRNQGQISGLTSGFADLDRLCCGLQPGDLIIVAGRPAMGKTSFGLTIAHHVAMQNKPVAVFSLEMSVAQLTQRIICAESMVDQQKVRTGKLTGEDWGNLVQAVSRLSKAQLSTDDTGGFNRRQLR
ncbi:MAG: replicative DNA helicase, partial [Clostridia bacterium]|nr:replicative DNA helicase [Clostridia bacterium]